ncbi:TonB-dependent receptor [Allosphingosinicella flava]|uniref:TonB-dependent receptor n=1 Tax=Allosphingosinicella flava TaxID=2771430 RepID=A0A7T2LLH1_9SPHN|nr:TonB-dependent receptor [Sphingosinicella flava]QPQ54368.1 TonB-dependent receptor [Sphingosinicella flava]
MRSSGAKSFSHLVVGVSAIAIAAVPHAAVAQDAAATVGQPGDSEVQQQAPESGEEIVVTGIRASLREAVDIKRNAQGVVDAISAEDIGKFPDTNLAESLQRITGVSIDRQNGEGSLVTVRGFGPEYNLVLLNGRQMPTSTLGDGASAPNTRSFDFANLASEGISAVEVYKTGRAAVPSGGIGSSINIRTPRPLDRPGMRGSVAARGVYDTSQNGGTDITPEISGIFSSTFGPEDRFGILISGVYQKRNASVNSANIDFNPQTGSWLGSDNNWGTLPRDGRVTNRPEGDDVYEVAQGASYSLTDIRRERINGQLVLQYQPTDSVTATVDYTYSRHDVEARNNSVGIWFNFGDTSSAWTDGPTPGPLFYTERFGDRTKDLSYSGSLTANRSENKSLGGNLTWEAPGGVTVSLDAHHSSAESKPTNDFGSSMSVGNAVYGVQSQTVNYENDLPIISVQMYSGIDPLNAALVTPTGNSFRNAYFKDRIDQVQLTGRYDHEGSFLDSLDFGVSYTDNKVRSAYGFIQNDTWGGIGPASDIPDDIFDLVSLPDKFKGVDGDRDGMIPAFYSFDVGRMVGLLQDLYDICGDPQSGSAQEGSCLANFTTDRRIQEKTLSAFGQMNAEFDLLSGPAHVIAGLRYDQTVVDSAALVPVPVGVRWVSAGEFAIIYSNETTFTRFKGDYANWLPAIDFDFEPVRDVKLRASYSHTITRADYGSLQGGLTVASNPRISGGDGNQGNPGLVPYKSKNIDLSAEWYYTPESYASVGYFHKKVENYIGSEFVETNAFGLRNPADGPRYRAAVAALGASATANQIRNYIFENFPTSTVPQRNPDGTFVRDANGNILGDILSTADDDPLNFAINTPSNSDQTATIDGWEFAVQHRFWDTGFGAILNYTIVNGSAKFDNTLDPSEGQFAITGLSDSANAVLYYDKGGLQARVAYNWRDEFYAGGNPDPYYVEAYGQVDASASYEFMPGLTAFVEAINLTGEGRRGHRRSQNFATFAQPGYARYTGGVRFTF